MPQNQHRYFPAVGWLLVIFALIITACSAPYSHRPAGLSAPVTFDTGLVKITTKNRTLAMQVELATKPIQFAYGLMDRDQLSQETGMLFLFNELQPADAGFWMYRTRIPLDIAFIDQHGKIISIHTMVPCPSPYPQKCTSYTAGQEYSAALEVNRGYFALHSISVGDRISTSPGQRDEKMVASLSL